MEIILIFTDSKLVSVETRWILNKTVDNQQVTELAKALNID